MTFGIDLTIFDAMEKSFAEAVASYFETVDILINTAGLLITKDFMEFTSGKPGR